MKILFLGPDDSPVLDFLRKRESSVVQTEAKLNLSSLKIDSVDFLVSYSYRHIIKADILRLFPNRAINLHISLLPWNRGADPNLWSFLEGTPKGVSIHYLDEGLDTGDIIVQREVFFDENQDTLASSYKKLQMEIQQLFYESWDSIRAGTSQRVPQRGSGSFHRSSDKIRVEHLLQPLGWDTPIKAVIGKAAKLDS